MSETRSSSLNSLTDILNDLPGAASDSHESSDPIESSQTENGRGGKLEIRRRLSDLGPNKINNPQDSPIRSLSLDDGHRVIAQFLASFPDDDVFRRGPGVSLR